MRHTKRTSDLPKGVLLPLIDMAIHSCYLRKGFNEGDNSKECWNTSLESLKQAMKNEGLMFRYQHNILSIGYFIAYGNEDELSMCPARHPW